MGGQLRRRGYVVAALIAALAASIPVASASETTCHGRAATVSGRYATGTNGNDVIVGTEGNDVLSGRGGNDTICGLGGNDQIEAGPGDDLVDGGGGADTFLPDFDAGPVMIDLAAGTASGSGNDELVVGTIENVGLGCSAKNNDIVRGDERANVISAGSGRDQVEGRGGNDTIFGTDPSVDRTDAICWQFEDDEDTLDGGDGDDTLFGQVSSDNIQGGSGWDVIDGGDDSDTCGTGERYARCEVIQDPAPPPECSDDQDNDGDFAADYPQDDECARRTDPDESRRDDPNCNDGKDNDGDGRVDFPADDSGCESLEDDTEYGECPFLCHRELTLSYSKGTFRGTLYDDSSVCRRERLIKVFKRWADDRILIGRTRTGPRGRYYLRRPRARGRFFAVAPRHTVTLSGGERVTCQALHSPTIRVRR